MCFLGSGQGSVCQWVRTQIDSGLPCFNDGFHYSGEYALTLELAFHALTCDSRFGSLDMLSATLVVHSSIGLITAGKPNSKSPRHLPPHCLSHLCRLASHDLAEHRRRTMVDYSSAFQLTNWPSLNLRHPSSSRLWLPPIIRIMMAWTGPLLLPITSDRL